MTIALIERPADKLRLPQAAVSFIALLAGVTVQTGYIGDTLDREHG